MKGAARDALLVAIVFGGLVFAGYVAHLIALCTRQRIAVNEVTVSEGARERGNGIHLVEKKGA